MRFFRLPIIQRERSNHRENGTSGNGNFQFSLLGRKLLIYRFSSSLASRVRKGSRARPSVSQSKAPRFFCWGAEFKLTDIIVYIKNKRLPKMRQKKWNGKLLIYIDFTSVQSRKSGRAQEPALPLSQNRTSAGFLLKC